MHGAPVDDDDTDAVDEAKDVELLVESDEDESEPVDSEDVEPAPPCGSDGSSSEVRAPHETAKSPASEAASAP